MSRYTTWERVIGKYPDVAKGRDASLAEPFIAPAEDEIDGYLGSLYTVPFSPVPGVVADLATDIAYYKMTWRQKGASDLKKYIDARVADLLSRKVGLGIEPSVQTMLTTSGTHSSFGMNDVTRQGIDPDWRNSYDYLPR